MSEFQCYQFKSIDRPLTQDERKEVDSWSSRAKTTSTSATFIYHYGNFKKDPKRAVEQYFDAMVYFSNWGTKQLIFRFPAALIDTKAISAYCFESQWESQYIRLEKAGAYYLLEIYFSDEEGGGWMDEEDHDIDALAPLRDRIINGDYAALYLAWAKFSQMETEEDDDDEHVDRLSEKKRSSPPPVPPNMRHISGALKDFINFFEIDIDLVTAAQSASQDANSAPPDYEKLLLQLTVNERIDWLSRLLKGEPRLDVLLKKRLDSFLQTPTPPPSKTISPAELRAMSALKEKERKAKEEAEALAVHVKKMKQLAGQEAALWNSVSFNIARKTGTSYDLATETLKDLKDLAKFQGKSEDFRQKLLESKQQYSRSTALTGRWDDAGLFR